jgi:glutamine synthetase adenylyltransferase
MSEFDALQTLYLGKETTVTGLTWNFGNSSVVLNNNPSEPNMVVNKSYVDSLFESHDKKIDTILDGSSISPDNFKNFVEYVESNKRANEAELLNNISIAINGVESEVNRASEAENEIKSSVQNEVNRASEAENEIKSSVQNEVNRASEAESKLQTELTELRSTIQNEINRSSANEITLKSDLKNELFSEMQTQLATHAESVASLAAASAASASAPSTGGVSSDELLALSAKIDALYQYFFKSNNIPL